jgi:hypothetical protein
MISHEGENIMDEEVVPTIDLGRFKNKNKS